MKIRTFDADCTTTLARDRKGRSVLRFARARPACRLMRLLGARPSEVVHEYTRLGTGWVDMIWGEHLDAVRSGYLDDIRMKLLEDAVATRAHPREDDHESRHRRHVDTGPLQPHGR